MTTIAQRADALLERRDVERLELSRGGEVLAELASDSEPRWMIAGPDGPRALAPETDEKLPVSARLADLRRERGAVVLAYRPGRRVVLRLEGTPDEPAGSVVKAGRRGRIAGMIQRHRAGSAAARAAGLDSAEVLDSDADLALYAMTDLGGARIAIEEAAAPRFARVGAALARFQAQAPAADLDHHGVREELGVLDGFAEKSSALTGSTPEGWSAPRERLAALASNLPTTTPVMTHRDLHDKQLLDLGESTALLDFDLLCRADAALDPANLLAHLELRALQGLASEAGARACARAVREGYGGGGADFEGRLRFWRAASLLRLALVYYLRPPWRRLSPELARRSLEELGGLSA